LLDADRLPARQMLQRGGCRRRQGDYPGPLSGILAGWRTAPPIGCYGSRCSACCTAVV